jgi:sialidase-1
MTWNFEKDAYSTIVNGTSEDTRRVFVTHSEDDGLTWSTPKEITDDAKLQSWTWYSTGPCHGIQISQGTYTGRLVIPCSFVDKASKKSYANIIYSDDDGDTWKLGGIVDKPGAGESTVAELSNGKLMLNMRTNLGVRFVATSDDGGLSWDDLARYSLIDPACQGSILSYRDGGQHYLFFSNPSNSTARKNMTIQMSTDDGADWESAYTVYAGPSGYSDMVMISDHQVGILYESGISGPHDHLAFEVISLDKFK